MVGLDQEKRIAIIDLGSNSARLTIWGVQENGCYRVIDKSRFMARMSAGMVDDTLQDAGMARAIEALRWFRQLMTAYGVSEVIALTTAAVRMARNQAVFLRRAREEAGIDLRVLSGDEEAYLDYLGVVNTLPVNDCVIVDTGGASTELILVRDRLCLERVSLPFGAVVLSERFLWEEDTPERIDALDRSVDDTLGGLPWIDAATGFPIVGLGGSNRALSRMVLERERRPYAPTHYHRIPAQQVLGVMADLLRMPVEARKAVPGMEAARADIVAGGFAPLKMLMRRLRSPELIVSACGLREGLFFRDIARDAADGLVPDVLESSAMNLLKRLHQNIEHCQLVARLGGALFERLHAALGLDPAHARLLRAASLLHDIGRVLSYDAHEIHGQRMILEVELFGLDHRERVLCSMIVGMHRARVYRPDFAGYGTLVSDADMPIVMRLAALLRIAEQLDRGQMGAVRAVRAEVEGGTVRMKVDAARDPSMQIASAMADEAFFREATGLRLEIANGAAAERTSEASGDIL